MTVSGEEWESYSKDVEKLVTETLGLPESQPLVVSAPDCQRCRSFLIHEVFGTRDTVTTDKNTVAALRAVVEAWHAGDHRQLGVDLRAATTIAPSCPGFVPKSGWGQSYVCSRCGKEVKDHEVVTQ